MPLSAAPGPNTAFIHLARDLMDAEDTRSNDIHNRGYDLIRVSFGFFDHRLVAGGLCVGEISRISESHASGFGCL